MAKRASAPSQFIYQLKITLRRSKPPIWRRVLVPSKITLGDLHYIILTVMGWDGDHLHAFDIAGVEYGEPDPNWADDIENETRAKLERVIPGAPFKFRYTYDFGDDWEHDILVEKVLPPEEGVRYPRCIAGRRHCPPEDVGGVWGYMKFLQAISDPAHPEHKNMTEWYSAPFDPEYFSVEAVNAALADPGRYSLRFEL